MFVEQLDEARELALVPFVINSGYRCESHDAALGGKGNHTTGWATDIKCETSRERLRIVKALLEVGFDRIGVGKTFIHVDDVTGRPPEVIWLY
jgi:hypothetical protein